MHKTSLVTPPATEPLEVSDIQTHLNVSGQYDYLLSLIKVARTNVERYLNRAIITQEWVVYYDCFDECLQIPYPVLQSVESVKYYDLDGTLQTLSTDNYWVDIKEEPGEVELAYGVTPPQLQYGRPNPIEIAYTAGYGDSSGDVPADIIHAMRLLVTNYYEHRGDIVISQAVSRIPSYVTDLIHGYRIYNF